MENLKPEEIIALSINSFDAWAEKVQDDGVDLNARLERMLPLLLKLSDPKILDLLERTLEQHESIDKLLELGTDVPNLVSFGVNTLDSLASKAQEQGIDIDERLQNLLTIAEILTSSKMKRALEFLSVHIDRFLHIGEVLTDVNRFNQKFAVFLEDITTSMVQTTDSPPQSVGGFFDILKNLKDRDVSRAMGFGFRFAKKFGEKLNTKI